MEQSSDKRALVAADLGALSCRVSLLRRKQRVPEITLIHRFPNSPIVTQNGLRWDVRRILNGVTEGLRLCGQAAPEGIASVAVDGWAVDYVRLGPDGNPVADPFCYRDPRNVAAMEQVHRLICPEELYSLTGIQLLSLNTLYQLYADKLADLDAHSPWLNLPEYVTCALGGERVAEYTNATHTQLVSVGTQHWCDKIFRAIGLDQTAAPKIIATGSIVGRITGELGELPAFRAAKLIVPACHDTASAIAAIPASGDDWAFISSGTWSLVGTVLTSPCISDEARRMNFTNLGGVGGTICFLKNVNGMWLLQQCTEEWERAGQHCTVEELVRQCGSLPAPRALIDVDDPDLMTPGNMPSKINHHLVRLGREPLPLDSRGIPFFANTIFHSLAKRYSEVLASIRQITGKKLQRLYIVGGASKNAFLNRLTAHLTGLEVLTGSSESSTLGNFAVQMAALQNDQTSTRGVTAESVAEYARTLATTPEFLSEGTAR
jgi:rhamnulokinase